MSKTFASAQQKPEGVPSGEVSIVYAFAGEGVHSRTSDLSFLRETSTFAKCTSILSERGMDIEKVLADGLGTHVASSSVIATTVINVCLADAWTSWGFFPEAACGHSVGEIAAAYVCGMLSLEEALEAAVTLGKVASAHPGAMLHTKTQIAGLETRLQSTDLELAAINRRFPDGAALVTLSGPEAAIKEWMANDAEAKRLRPMHPWHHPCMAATVDTEQLRSLRGEASGPCRFFSATAGKELQEVGGAHWKQWLCKPVDFAGMVEELATYFQNAIVVEIGAHPIFNGLFADLHPAAQVSSMCRDQGTREWILSQRALVAELAPSRLLKALSGLAVDGISLSIHDNFGSQGFTSNQYQSIANVLAMFFPGVKPIDLYRFPSIGALMKGFGVPPSHMLSRVSAHNSVGAAVIGAAVTAPAAVSTCDDFWSALLGNENAVRQVKGHSYRCGFLDPSVFNARAVASELGLEASEADVIDPQHVLALSLAARCFEDAGKDALADAIASPDRFGVYLGAWQEPPRIAQKTSAFKVIGNSLAAMASRVANTYNIQGPAVTINTACSSSLVAVDAALRDMRRGIIDFALVGGVNLLADDSLTADLARAQFISPSGACHTFSSGADGYARSEGGVMMLLTRDDGKRKCRAIVCGAATNQNSQRRPMTAVDPVAQERVIRGACADAGISPRELAAVECHGTGTKLGDPVEVSALAATVGSRRATSPCQLTAAKMRFGHLESAAGAIGLLKAVLMAQRRCVPGDTIDDSTNPAVLEAMNGAAVRLPVPENTALEEGAYIGVSSFGFSGNNAHAIVRAVPAHRVCDYKEIVAPRKAEPEPLPPPPPPHPDVSRVKSRSKKALMPAVPEDVPSKVWRAAESVCKGISDGNSEDDSIFELGMDSLGLAEMLVQLEASFGEGCITVDDIMNNPTVSAISGVLRKSSRSPAADDQASVQHLVWKAAESVCADISEGNRAEESMFELGLDSLGLAEMIIQLESSFGEGCISVDEVMDNPTVASVTNILQLKSTAQLRQPTTIPPVTEPSGTIEMEAGLQSLGGQAKDLKDVQQWKSSANWVRITHVGSLPRGGAGASLSDIIQKQVDIGVDILNDGEWARENYISDALSRITNIGKFGDANVNSKGLCDMPCACDMHDVPMFCRRYTGGNGLITLNPSRVARADVACTGELAYQNSETLFASLNPFLDSIADRDRETCFWTVPSPGTLGVFCEDRYYGDHCKFVRALAEALREEYAAIAKTGLLLQVDAPDLAMGRHTKHAALTDDAFLQVLACNVDCINYALAGIPASQVRVHVCWGNYAGPHHKDIEARLIWDQVLRLNAKYISIEGANSRHSHDWECFSKHFARGFITEGKVLMPGVIDTRTPTVEHPDLIAQRIMQYVRVLGIDRVVASTDCGFATTAKSAAVTEDIAWLKLSSLAEGAKRASKIILNMGAPAPTSMAYKPTGFRVVIVGDAESAPDLRKDLAARAWSLSVLPADTTAEQAFQHLKYAIDTPVAVVALSAKATDIAKTVLAHLRADSSISRRPFTMFTFCSCEVEGAVHLGTLPVGTVEAAQKAAQIQSGMQGWMCFNKRQLVPNSAATGALTPVAQADVVIVGGGLLGLLAAVQLRRRGFKPAVFEQRSLVGGIWSMYANSHSQVNSSEGGYSLKDVLGEDGANRDHSTAREMITDIAKLAKEVESCIYCGVKVLRILKGADGYNIVTEASQGGCHITFARGVIIAINDRVGIPRAISWARQDRFQGIIASGTNDNLAGVDWREKRVVIVGMGAFAIENARTALEHGAAHVTVLVRRHGTVCPKIIDYLNFVKPFDENYQHDTTTNIKQMRQWSDLYRKSGATIPECWPEEIKHEGHTISVSDLWFVGHHMKKLCTKASVVESFDESGMFLADGSYLEADVVIPCIGFTRNTSLCSALTGIETVKNTNYLDKHMMYLADAEIDHGAFNWFFGSSVLEYAKYFTEVYITGLEHEDEVGELLWGDSLPTNHIDDRKWSQYIAASSNLIKAKNAGIPYFANAAEEQVARRTKHFYATLPPKAYVEANQMEWVELHTRLNGGVPVPVEQQLPYFFKDAASWCER